MKQYIETISKVPLFKGIDIEELEHILACFTPSIKHFHQGEYITLEGHDYYGIGIVLKGLASITKTNESGERIIMSHIGQGELFGEMIAFSALDKWPATVIAKEDCVIMWMTPDAILNHCQRLCVGHKQLMLNMLEIISNKALGLNRKLNYLSIKSMRGKLSKFILEQKARTGKDMFEIPYNRNELAEFLHVSRPSMSRELSRMKEEGIIDYYQSTFKILDPVKLGDYASHLN